MVRHRPLLQQKQMKLTMAVPLGLDHFLSTNRIWECLGWDRCIGRALLRHCEQRLR